MAATGVIHILALMLQGVRSTAANFGRLPFRLQFVMFWLLGVMWLLFNAPSLFGERAVAQQIVYLMYISSLSLAFTQTKDRSPLIGVGAADFLITFALWVAVGAALFKFVQPFNPERAVLTTAAIGILATHALVVAIGEELLFRFAIPSLIPGSRMVAQTVSALAFGFMHYAAYTGSLANLLFASLLGLFFGAIVVKVPRNGIIIAMALHFTWNAYTLGFL